MSLRSRLSLDGVWLFWQDPSATLEPGTLAGESARKVTVPAPWQSQGQGLERDTGIGWYQRDVDVPAEWLAQRVVIGFGAVDDIAEVWLNEVRVGGHEGGYLPFELDVTDAVRAGANTLTVRVADPVELGKPTKRDAALGRRNAVLDFGIDGAIRRLDLLVDEAISSVPPCPGINQLRGMIMREAEHFLPKELTRIAA